jgi:hypothetical protein
MTWCDACQPLVDSAAISADVDLAIMVRREAFERHRSKWDPVAPYDRPCTVHGQVSVVRDADPRVMHARCSACGASCGLSGASFVGPIITAHVRDWYVHTRGCDVGTEDSRFNQMVACSWH